MTDQEWLECTEPTPLLNFVQETASLRKLRLFAVACCYSIWNLLTEEYQRNCVEVAEQYADGKATILQLKRSEHDACVRVGKLGSTRNRRRPSPMAAWWVVSQSPASAVQFASEASPDPECELHTQCKLLRDIIGNPFCPCIINHAWLRWNDSCIERIAQVIYDERAFDRLPILADALEDAGCDNADMLTHCRSGGEHVRGCWVVDLLLGKS